MGSVLTQHQSHKTETDGHRNTRDGSPGWPGALLEISNLTGEVQYVIFYNLTLGLGKTTNSQDRFLVIQHWASKIELILGLNPQKRYWVSIYQ